MSGIGYDRFVGHDMQTFEYGNATITYGGALVAHALSAAIKTVEDPKFLIQSLHCYYVGAPNSNLDVVYHVTRLKDGRTISTRGVTATQSRKIVFSCLVSLSVEEKDELGLSHTDCPMPQVHPLPQPGQTKFADVHPHSKVPLNRFPFQQLFVSNKSDDMNVAK